MSLYEVELLCSNCHAKYKEILSYAGYRYCRCKFCGSYSARRIWQSEAVPVKEASGALNTKPALQG